MTGGRGAPGRGRRSTHGYLGLPREAGVPAEAGQGVNLARHLRRDLILLELRTRDVPPEEREEIPRARYLLAQKEKILDELVELLDRSGRVSNRRKLLADLWNREKKASTGLKGGVAVPHVRTSQAKECLFAFARSTAGVEFGCLDGRLAHLFFVLVTPPYEDTLYLRIYKQIATAFSVGGEGLLREFLEAGDEGEILRTMRKLV